MDHIEVSAKTLEEAIAKGEAQLTAEGRRITETKVIEQPSSGFLGIGRRPAIVRLYFEDIEMPTVASVLTETTKAKADEIVVEETVAVADTSDTVAEEADVNESVDETPVATEETSPSEEVTAKPEKPGLTKEDQMAIADKGKQFLTDMFAKMGLAVAIEKMTTEGRITFQIHGDDLGILIGKHGQTLDAIQYLTNLVANKDVKGRCHIVVDVEHYRSRREDTLVQLARRLGDKVKRSRQKISLEPMNAFERKIIHLTLQNEPHIVTDSEGEEPYRHVVIAYKR